MADDDISSVRTDLTTISGIKREKVTVRSIYFKNRCIALSLASCTGDCLSFPRRRWKTKVPMTRRSWAALLNEIRDAQDRSFSLCFEAHERLLLETNSLFFP
jgi:hypothetical protein